MAPGGVGRTPNQKRDTRTQRLRSSTFHSFETPQEPKMLRALKDLGEAIFARYNRFPPRRHVQTLFISEIEFHFLFLGQKSQKVDLKASFSFSKNSIILNDLLAGASEHKSEKFFFVFKFLKYFEIFNILKKEFDSPLSYNCNLYLKTVLKQSLSIILIKFKKLKISLTFYIPYYRGQTTEISNIEVKNTGFWSI